METILNVTQHYATIEQIDAGVIEPLESHKAEIKNLLTFDELPLFMEMVQRADKIVSLIEENYDVDTVMLGAAPFFTSILESTFKCSFMVVYAFSKRVTEEETLPSGEVKKTQHFKHLGFIEV